MKTVVLTKLMQLSAVESVGGSSAGVQRGF